MITSWLNTWSCDLAIDLGTATTSIATPGPGILVREPSLVAVEPHSRRILGRGAAVGELAYQMQGRTPSSIQIIRPISAGVVADDELGAGLLRSLLERSRPNVRWRRRQAIMAIGGSMTPVERRALDTTAARAGIGRLDLISKCKAAALGAGLPIHEPLASMVCDLGAGSTEVAILSLGEVVATAALRLGGDAFDQAIVDYVRREHHLRIGRHTAEQLKIDLGFERRHREASIEVRGADAATCLPRSLPLTTTDIRAALTPALAPLIAAIRCTLDACPPELVGDLVEQGLVLTGGQSLLVGLDRHFSAELELPVRVAEEPERAIITGLLRCLEDRDRWHSHLEPRSVLRV